MCSFYDLTYCFYVSTVLALRDSYVKMESLFWYRLILDSSLFFYSSCSQTTVAPTIGLFGSGLISIENPLDLTYLSGTRQGQH